MNKRCERCGASKSNPDAGPYNLFDYCANCSRDLCDACMEKGCCGHVPALSGADADCGGRLRRPTTLQLKTPRRRQ